MNLTKPLSPDINIKTNILYSSLDTEAVLFEKITRHFQTILVFYCDAESIGSSFRIITDQEQGRMLL